MVEEEFSFGERHQAFLPAALCVRTENPDPFLHLSDHTLILSALPFNRGSNGPLFVSAARRSSVSFDFHRNGRNPDDATADWTCSYTEHDRFLDPVHVCVILLGAFRDRDRQAVISAHEERQLKPELADKLIARLNGIRAMPTGEIAAVSKYILSQPVAE